MSPETADASAAVSQGSGVPKGKLTKGQRTRQKIFDVAFELFAQRGFQGVSIRDIAAHVGITHVAVLHYFSSKDELLTELMLHRDEVEREASEDFLASDHEAHPEYGGLVSPALRWFMYRLHRNAQVPGAVPLFLKISTEASDPQHPAHQHFVRRYAFVIERLTGAFAEEFAARPDRGVRVEPRVAAQHMVAIADGLQIQEIYQDEANLIVDDAWEYLRLLGIATQRPNVAIADE